MHFWGSWTAGYADVGVVVSKSNQDLGPETLMAEGGGTSCGTGDGRGQRRLTWLLTRCLRPIFPSDCGHHPTGCAWPCSPEKTQELGVGAQRVPHLPAGVVSSGNRLSVLWEISYRGEKAGKFPLNASSLLGGVVQGNEYTKHTENITFNFSELLFTKNAALINWDFRTSALQMN